MEKIGVLAGKGNLPVLVAKQIAEQQNAEPVCISFDKENVKLLESHAPRRTFHFPVTKVGKILTSLKEQGVRKLIFAGKVEKSLLYRKSITDLFDTTALRLLPRLIKRNDDNIMLTLIGFLEEEGFEVLKQTDFLSGYLLGEGVHAGKEPDRETEEDIRFGFGMAKGIAGLDIGQTVIVKKRAVIAVEAIEGTDKAIARAGELLCRDKQKGGVVIKVAKPKQDERFDIPTIGKNTLEVMAHWKLSTLAVEADKTFCPDFEEVLSFAQSCGITIVGVK